jgi:hypothetical protein
MAAAMPARMMKASFIERRGKREGRGEAVWGTGNHGHQVIPREARDLQ